jgi:uncharacterized protein (DUF58 family)
MNNLLYVFVFLLISMAVTSMWVTNKNAESAELLSLNSLFLFANEKNKLQVNVKNRHPRISLWDLRIKVRHEKDIPDQNILQIKPFSTQSINVEWVPVRRGLQTYPRLHLSTHFPFQLLNAWKYFQVKDQVIIYPERRGDNPLPRDKGSNPQHETASEDQTQGFFRDYRDFQTTDSPSRIAWRKSLKVQKHLVKNFEANSESNILIDWEMTTHLLNDETRISQMAQWIESCHRRNIPYRLKIKDAFTSYSLGIPHYKHCMETLAFLDVEQLK